ncbi:hypothetical protein CASFOL_026210 [Castilleja foliolosa]|uniref:Uncharacterized protein n=1 Tax=Castilleja foliolosa TaxID=1961234 RepID=A0ABD3CJT4_9LAMI
MTGFIITVMMILVSAVMGSSSSSSLDALLQEYAYGSLVGPRIMTGDVYDRFALSNLTGIGVSAMRLRSGSLRSKGVNRYKEFEIPKGIIVNPYVERLVLVYHNLGNLSVSYYPPPPGYTYLAPVLGLLSYDASDLTAKALPVLNIHPSAHPISVHFSALVKRVTGGDDKSKKCVLFDLDGSLNLTNVSSDNVCTAFQQGHFSIVVEEGDVKENKGDHLRVWIIVGSIAGVFVLLALVGVVFLWVRKYRRRKRMSRMERAAEGGEALRMADVGSTRAPAATGTRTQPTIETEYVP